MVSEQIQQTYSLDGIFQVKNPALLLLSVCER